MYYASHHAWRRRMRSMRFALDSAFFCACWLAFLMTLSVVYIGVSFCISCAFGKIRRNCVFMRSNAQSTFAGTHLFGHSRRAATRSSIPFKRASNFCQVRHRGFSVRTGKEMNSTDEKIAFDDVTPAVWTGFAMMCVGMFMAILDVQVVATSLPTIQQALNIEQDQMSWIQTAYLIAEIIAIPLTGFLMRTLQMRCLFTINVIAFTLASIACAMSESFLSLITFRVFQGFFGGTLIPIVFS